MKIKGKIKSNFEFLEIFYNFRVFEMEIFLKILENPQGLTIYEIQSYFDLDRTSIQKKLRKLYSDNLISRKNNPKLKKGVGYIYYVEDYKDLQNKLDDIRNYMIQELKTIKNL